MASLERYSDQEPCYLPFELNKPEIFEEVLR